MEPSSVNYSKPVYSPSQEEKELAPKKAEPPPNDQEETALTNSTIIEKQRAELEAAHNLQKKVLENSLTLTGDAAKRELGKREALDNIEVPREKEPRLENTNYYFTESQTGPVESLHQASVVDKILKQERGKLLESKNNITDELSNELKKLFDERSSLLESIEDTYNQMCQAIDSKHHPSVCTKYFPPTACWLVGPLTNSLVQQMVTFGKKLGITVLTYRSIEVCKENTIFFSSKCLQPFPQDYCEVSPHNIRLLAMPTTDSSIDDERAKKIINESRQKRDPDLWGEIKDEKSPLNFILKIGINWGSHQKEEEEERTAYLPLELALICGIPVSMNLTYSEGGNVVWAEREGQPYALIGKDSLDFSTKILEEGLGDSPSEQTVRMAFAIDYGLKMENIIFVEQPDFHLDTSIIAVGSNSLIVNDSLAALPIELKAQLQTLSLSTQELDSILKVVQNIIETEKSLEKFRKVDYEEILSYFEKIMSGKTKAEIEIATASSRNAIIRSRLESKAQRDIEKEGFKVERLPGRFYESNTSGSQTEVANFLNVVTASEGNRKLVVMNGCDEVFKPYMQKVQQQFRKYHSTSEVEFTELSPDDAKKCLERYGGVSCITKSFY